VYKFTRHIPRICTNAFRIFGDRAVINLNIQNAIIFFNIAFKGTLLQKRQLDPKTIRKKILLSSSITKVFFPHILRIHGMNLKFEYLGKIDFIFETNLGFGSGYTRWILMMKKIRSHKSSCKCTFMYLNMQLHNFYSVESLGVPYKSTVLIYMKSRTFPPLSSLKYFNTKRDKRQRFLGSAALVFITAYSLKGQLTGFFGYFNFYFSEIPPILY
jgi:hypothetical protein